MKKKLLFIPMVVLFAVMCLTSCSEADDELAGITMPNEELSSADDPFAVSIDEAQKMLEEILASDNEQVTRSGGIARQRRIKNRYATGGDKPITRSVGDSETSTDHPLLYVFNFEDNEGFAVMGADKRGAPLLALTESGELTPGMTTDNFGFVASMAQAEAVYRQMIVEAGSDTTVITNGCVVSITIKDSVVVNRWGQCPVHWNQFYPSNMLCPPNYYGPDNYPSGCVPLAVAQLMTIHSHPSSFGSYTFNWSGMISEVPDTTGIALLLNLLGTSENLDVTYNQNGSNALFENVPRTLQNFGYLYSGTYDIYDPATVMSNVLVGLPVLMGGDETKFIYVGTPPNTLTYNGYEIKRHAWLVDGGKITTITTHVYNLLTGEHLVLGPTHTKYIHCNFGWGGGDISNGGLYDGLFLCDYINTTDDVDSTSTYGYTYIYDHHFQYGLKMVTGISPY